MSALNTPLTQLLGCRYPIIQTAMGWVADPTLVAASSEAGAFGFLAGAVMTPGEIDEGIRAIKSRTEAPFGVNFHMYAPGARETVDLCVEHGVRAVSYSRSPSGDLVEKLKSAGIVCIPTVGALKHAIKAVQLGADAVVVQGSEGGGHTGTVASSVLLPQVLKSVSVPVVAAGGFSTGRDLAALLAQGAAGMAMGTRFLLTAESPVPEQTKQRYIAASAEDIIVSRQLDGMPQRMINNELLQRLQSTSGLGMLLMAAKNGLAFTKLTRQSLFGMMQAAWKMSRNGDMSLGQSLMAANAPMMIQEAMVRGHPSNGILPSGQVAGAIDDLPAVADLVARMAADAEAAIQRLNTPQ